MKTPPAPAIDKALLDHLQGLYRTDSEVPPIEVSQWEIGKRAGIKAVLAYLERVFKEQQDKGPTGNVLKQT